MTWTRNKVKVWTFFLSIFLSVLIFLFIVQKLTWNILSKNLISSPSSFFKKLFCFPFLSNGRKKRKPTQSFSSFFVSTKHLSRNERLKREEKFRKIRKTQECKNWVAYWRTLKTKTTKSLEKILSLWKVDKWSHNMRQIMFRNATDDI